MKQQKIYGVLEWTDGDAILGKLDTVAGITR